LIESWQQLPFYFDKKSVRTNNNTGTLVSPP